MQFKKTFYPESKISGFSNVDGTLAFYIHVNALLTPASIVVDIGSGRGAYGEDPVQFRKQLRILRGKCQKVIGLDIDPQAETNPFVDKFCLIDGNHWPVADNLADICLADNVLEHVEDPDTFFSECYRVLKPGGMVCIRTPNLFSYFGLISRLVPWQKRMALLKRAKDRVVERDVFPVFYRCNTIPKVRQKLREFGFDPVVYGYDSEPGYLSFSRLFYILGVLHQRFAPGFLKVVIHAFGRKVM